MLARIKKDDLVQIMSGKDKLKQGRILKIDGDRVLVEGAKIVTKHQKPIEGFREGGLVREESFIHISNVMPVDPSDEKPTRIRTEIQDGKKVRVSVRTGTVIK